MAVLKTSQEINKAFGAYHNKFYPRRKMLPYAANDRTGAIWFCQIAVKTHDEGLKCPFCGGAPNPDDWYSKVEFRGYDDERHLNLDPFILSEGSCSKCSKWWQVRTNPGDKGAVVLYDEPRSAHDYHPVIEEELK